MKFKLALGLLLASFVSAELVDPKEISVDNFLRDTQHLAPSAELVSIKQNGQFYTVTYKDGPMNAKFDLRTKGDQMKIVGIQKVVSFSNDHRGDAFMSGQHQQIKEGDQLQPLPLIMPTFTFQQDGSVRINGVFDVVQKEMQEMQKRMEEDRKNFENMMEGKRQEMHEKFNRRFDEHWREIPLIGGGDHDNNWATQGQTAQPLLGGDDHDYTWDLIQKPNQPLIGGDHDYNWATQTQLTPDHPLIGGDHDYNEATQIDFQNHPIIGGDDHDNWQMKRQQHPLIGGDDHDNWKQKKHHKNLKNQGGLIGGGKHDNWKSGKHHQKKNKHHEGREMRHHSNAWMQREFETEEVIPYLNEKLPALMQDGQVVSVENKGFEKGKGFTLDIKVKSSKGDESKVVAFFRPRKGELLIDRIETMTQSNHLETGKQLLQSFIKGLEEKIEQPAVELEGDESNTPNIPLEIEFTDSLIAPDFIPELKPNLLGGEQDPDHDPEFMKMAKEIQLKEGNHAHESENIVYDIPLLGGDNDPDHAPELIPNQPASEVSDSQAQPIVQEKSTEEKTQVFDVTGLPLPGGQTDIDNAFDLEKMVNAIKDIAEKIMDNDNVEDIEEAQQPTTQDEKLKLLIK